MFEFEFILNFIQVYFISILYLSPVFIFLTSIIVLLSLYVGRRERWRWKDSIYFGFITATTVGYGDKTPTSLRTRTASIVITFIGLLTTGIFVAAGMQALTVTIKNKLDKTAYVNDIEKILDKEIKQEVKNQIDIEIEKVVDLKIKNLLEIKRNLKNDSLRTLKGE